MRKIIQISCTDNRMFALTSDGKVWEWNHNAKWDLHDSIPQDDLTEICDSVATPVELSVTKLVNMVYESKHLGLIMKALISRFITDDKSFELQNLINSTILNTHKVDDEKSEELKIVLIPRFED